MRKLILTALVLFPVTALADPWCLVKDAVDACTFVTADQCYQQANISGGYCKPNPRQLGLRGAAPYCVVTAGERNCRYRNKAACLNEAIRLNGGCVRNTELDLARRAAGEGRLEECFSGDANCESSFGDGGFGDGGLQNSAGF